MLKTIFSVLAAITMLLSGILGGGEKQQSGKLQSSSPFTTPDDPGIYEFHFYKNDLFPNFFSKW